MRTRTYVDSGTCWVEVKTRGQRGATVKTRLPHEVDELRHHVGGGGVVAHDDGGVLHVQGHPRVEEVEELRDPLDPAVSDGPGVEIPAAA